MWCWADFYIDTQISYLRFQISNPYNPNINLIIQFKFYIQGSTLCRWGTSLVQVWNTNTNHIIIKSYHKFLLNLDFGNQSLDFDLIRSNALDKRHFCAFEGNLLRQIEFMCIGKETYWDTWAVEILWARSVQWEDFKGAELVDWL